MHAIGLNFADVFACLGLYSATPQGAFIPGLEFAGVVEEMVSAPERTTAGLRPGDRVFGVTRFGAYTTALNLPLHLLARVPEDWSMSQAAAFPVHGLTAWYGLIDQGRVQRDDVVLVHSAGGGVGLFAVRILRSVGARIVATVGSEEKRRFLLEHHGFPAEGVIVRDRQRFGDQLDRALQAAHAEGFDVVFDAVSGPYLQPAFNRLRPRGRLVVYGAADFMPRGTRGLDQRLLLKYIRRPRVDPLALVSQNRSVMGFNLIWLWDQADRLANAYATLRQLCPDPPYVGHSFPFSHAPEAMRFLQSGKSIGKVVLDLAP